MFWIMQTICRYSTGAADNVHNLNWLNPIACIWKRTREEYANAPTNNQSSKMSKLKGRGWRVVRRPDRRQTAMMMAGEKAKYMKFS